MHLSPPVRAYFDASATVAGELPLQAFTPDAVVRDEGEAHVGHGAIAAWWRASQKRYQATASPFDSKEEGGRTLVRATVTGQFPGSPADLTFAFELRGDAIAALEVTP